MTVATKVRLLSPRKKSRRVPHPCLHVAQEPAMSAVEGVGFHGRHSATGSDQYLFWLRRKEKVDSLGVLCTHFSAYSAFKVLTFDSLCVLCEITSLRTLRLRF
jgi:hypothetical protein